MYRLFLLTIFAQLLSIQLYSQLLSLTELETKPFNEQVTRYFYKGAPYTGMTYDRHEKVQKVMRHVIENGFIQRQLGYDYDNNKVRDYAFKDGVLHGKVLLYFGNGQKYIEENYVNGLSEGKQYGWYRDGSLRFYSECTAGKEYLRYEYPKSTEGKVKK